MRINSLRTLLLIVPTIVLTACQTPMQSGSQCLVEPGYFATIHEFAWTSDEPVDVIDNTGYVSPIAVRSLSNAAAKELERKGFTLTESRTGQGMEVALALRTRRELVSYESSGSPCLDVDCWERIDPGAETRMDIQTIGFLAADVFYQGEPIWRGWVETTLFPKDRDRAAEVIATAIPKLFETFPP